MQCADGAQRTALTLILFLLDAASLSRWHRVCGADETWQFIGGAPLELLMLSPDGDAPMRLQLGFRPHEPALTPVAVVPACWWQAARSLGDWSLVIGAEPGAGLFNDPYGELDNIPGGYVCMGSGGLAVAYSWGRWLPR